MITYILAGILNISPGNYIKTEISTTSEITCLKSALKLAQGTRLTELCSKWKIDENTGIGVKI